MVKTEDLDTKLEEKLCQRFHFPWCTGYSTKQCHWVLDLLIHKEPKNFRLHTFFPILLFNIESNICNKYLWIYSMVNSEELYGLYPEQYDICRAKAAGIQALNTRLLYELIRQNRIYASSTFFDLISNWDLLVHIISFILLQRVDFPNWSILCTFTTLQNMINLVREYSGYSNSTYGRETWVVTLNPPSPPLN